LKTEATFCKAQSCLDGTWGRPGGTAPFSAAAAMLVGAPQSNSRMGRRRQKEIFR
jgi:hypothetical protein